MRLAARGARDHDDVEIARLRARAEAELRATPQGAALADELSVRSAVPRHLALVELDGVPVGYCEADVLRRTAGPVCRVSALYVEPEARGVGAGAELMDHVIEWAQAEGCAGIDAVVLPGARESKNFFEGTGFTARLLVMRRRLDGG